MDNRYPGSVSDYSKSYRILSIISDTGYPNPINCRICPLNLSESDWALSDWLVSDIR